MTFGEVGETTITSTTGRSSKMTGVGAFTSTKLLERQRLIEDLAWTTAETAGTTLVTLDLLQQLAAVPDNADILEQFNFFRSGIEVTVRLNTNQFYYGALGVTLFPPGTGARLDERMFQSPSIISASSAQAVVKEWKYSLPFEWVAPVTIENSTLPINLVIDVLAPLTASGANMPTSITLQVWARFKDIELSYPSAIVTTSIVPNFTLGGAINVEKQSKVMVPKPSGSRHPNASSNSTEDSVQEVFTSLEHVTIGDALTHIPGISTLFSALSFLVDKPDKTEEQTVVVSDHNVDMWNVDLPDIGTSMSVHRGRYMDPSVSRLPMASNMTLSQYAQTPGLRGPSEALPVWVFAANGDSTDLVSIIQLHSDNSTMKTALDYATLCSTKWRGGMKIMLQFFAPSFSSARFVVQYHNSSLLSPSPFVTEYDSTLSRVVNVKGDTVDCFTVPWLNFFSWANTNANQSPSIAITLDSVIASTDTAVSPKIYMLLWVSGAEDIQFAGPRRISYNTDWSNEAPSIQKQAMIHDLFKQPFVPIVENCMSDIDNGYATSEQLGSMADISKRYSPLVSPVQTTPVLPPGFAGDAVNANYLTPPGTITIAYLQYVQFRRTLYGQMRSAFLYTSGGFRFRRVCSGTEYWTLITGSDLVQGSYTTSSDNMIRVTVPYSCNTPFQALDLRSAPYSVVYDPDNSVTVPVLTTPQWIAARDDVMYGWPILPAGLFVTPPSAVDSTEDVINLRKTRGKGKERT